MASTKSLIGVQEAWTTPPTPGNAEVWPDCMFARRKHGQHLHEQLVAGGLERCGSLPGSAQRRHHIRVRIVPITPATAAAAAAAVLPPKFIATCAVWAANEGAASAIFADDHEAGGC